MEVISALKVLGVVAQVSLGPKAPCGDLEMPVSIQRIKTVLGALGVSSDQLENLTAIMGGKVDRSEENDSLTVLCALTSSSGLHSREDHNLQGDMQTGDVRMLKDVLRALLPESPRELSGISWIVDCLCSRIPDGISRGCTACSESLFSLCMSCTRRQPSVSEADDKDETLDEAKKLQKKRLHRDAVENTFRAHALHQCPLCAGGFRKRKIFNCRKDLDDKPTSMGEDPNDK